MANGHELAVVVPENRSAPPAPLALDTDGAHRLREAFLAGRNANTRRAYAQTAADFAGYLSRRIGRTYGEAEALGELLRAGPGAANLVALEYRADLLARELAPGTVALRLSNLRAAVKLARTLGMVAWTLEVASPRVERYRDTSGPGVDAVRAMTEAVRSHEGVRAARDRALLALLYGQGLRRGEVVSLDVEHVDAAGARLSVLGKGKLEREWVHVTPAVLDVLQGWIAVHPSPRSGPLFLGWDATTGAPHGRLSGRAVAKLTNRYGMEAVGVPVRPHGLRHTAATALLDAGLSWAEVAGFTRHRDPSTLRHYDDNRAKRGATAARRLAELVRL
jgi:integrase/recombinase XerC